MFFKEQFIFITSDSLEVHDEEGRNHWEKHHSKESLLQSHHETNETTSNDDGGDDDDEDEWEDVDNWDVPGVRTKNFRAHSPSIKSLHR